MKSKCLLHDSIVLLAKSAWLFGQINIFFWLNVSMLTPPKRWDLPDLHLWA
jgi:hypothetical protein